MYENLLTNLFEGYPFMTSKNELTSYEFMKTSIKENKESYVFEIEMPGIKKENIAIDLDGENLKVLAKNNDDFALKEGEKLLLNERTTGTFKRNFYLGRHFTHDQVEASFENGVLKITLHKAKEENTPTRVEIK